MTRGTAPVGRVAPRIGLLIVAVMTVVATAAPALADDLAWEGDVTYTPDVEAGTVHVEAGMGLTNLKPSVTSGGVTTSYYYDRITVYIPESAESIAASSSSGGVSFDIETSDQDGLDLLTIQLGTRLFYGQSTTVTVEYDVRGDPPRSESIFRVNPAYVNFPAVGWGDPNNVEIHVVLPKQFNTNFAGEPYTFDVVGDIIVYEFDDISDPDNFLLSVQAWDDDGLTVSRAGLDDHDIVVKSWPDDPEWSTDVLEAVDTGLPVLQQMVGLPWRPEETLDILESQKVTLAGYGGWYLGGDEEIHIGEWVDPHLVLHELSHTWFNGTLFEERWITEGLADEFASEAVTRSGMVSSDYPRLSRAPLPFAGSFALNDWGIPDQSVTDVERYEAFGYGTSRWVLQELAKEIGHERLAEVVAAADSNQIAYRSGETIETVDHEEDDWRRFLDLVEEVGGSESATGLFAEYVTTVDLTERTAARESYDSLRDTDWGIPLYVRQPMEDWDFAVAGERIDEAGAIVAMAEDIDSAAETLGVEAPASLEEEYEGATGSLETIALIAESHLDTSTHLLDAGEAISEDRDLLEEVGLFGRDVGDELDAAADAFAAGDIVAADAGAAGLVDLMSHARQMGVVRVAIVVSALTVLVAIIVGIAGRRRKPLPDQLPT